MWWGYQRMRTWSLSEQRDVRQSDRPLLLQLYRRFRRRRLREAARRHLRQRAVPQQRQLHGSLRLIDFAGQKLHCPFGFDGINCENPINYCSVLEPCRNDVFCITGVSFEPVSFQFQMNYELNFWECAVCSIFKCVYEWIFINTQKANRIDWRCLALD